MFDQPLSAEHARMILFFACILVASLGGYVLRRWGWAKREWAPRLMSAAIIGCDAPIALLAVWYLTIQADVWKVPVAGAIVSVATCLVGLAVASRLRLPPRDRALVGLQGGMGNVGYTLGGALCFALWGVQGLAREQLFCVMYPFFVFLFCFPIARHYGELASGTPTGPRLSAMRYAVRILGRSLIDLRSLPLYMVTIGLVLSLRGVAPPTAIKHWHIIDGLMILGIFLQFGGVGLTVRVRRLPQFWKPAMGTAALKLIVSPLLMVGVALALGLSGMPLYVCILLAAMPTALYSVLMANLFGLDRDLANATFILTHAICLVVIVPVLFLFLPT